MSTWYELVKSVEGDAVQEWAAYAGSTDIEDMAHELADARVPVYTSDLLTLAADNTALATDVPDLGPAFDGTPTPVNIIAANIYDRLYEVALEALQDIEGEEEEE